MFDILEKRYNELAYLGTVKELTEYLAEELKFIQLQKIDINSYEVKDKSNSKNILSLYLLDKADKPKKLHHYFSSGDYPDIDVDFSQANRETVISYIKYVFGEDKVMSACTFSKAGIKASLLDLSQALGIPREEVLVVTKTFDNVEDMDSEEGLEVFEKNNESLKKLFEKYPLLKQYAVQYRDVIRQIGKHAAAIIISDVPLREYMPLIKRKDEVSLGFIEGQTIKELQPQGFIKFDALGLKNLDIIQQAIEYVKKHYDTEIDWNKIDINDPKAYKIATPFSCDGIFQMEGNAAKKVIEVVKPQNFDDLVFVNAAMRPGAMEANAPEAYAKRKKGDFSGEYPSHKDLAKYNVNSVLIDMLDRSAGLCIYQESTMYFLHYVGDIDLPTTNKVRKVITKPPAKREEKDSLFLEKIHDKYMDGAINRGMSKELAQKWWDAVVGQAGYSFNLSHCVAYALIAFRELWLKVHYPEAFYAALFNSEHTNKDSKLSTYITKAQRFGIKILHPDINLSEEKCTIEGNRIIRLGFTVVGELQHNGIKKILEKRPFKDKESFFTEKWNKGDIWTLIYSGALDSFDKRSELMLYYARLDKKNDYILPVVENMAEEEKRRISLLLTPCKFNDFKELFQNRSFATLVERNEYSGYWFRGIVQEVQAIKNGYKILVYDFRGEAELFITSYGKQPPRFKNLETQLIQGDVIEFRAETKYNKFWLCNKDIVKLNHIKWKNELKQLWFANAEN